MRNALRSPIELAKGFCRAKFWAKFASSTFGVGQFQVQGEVFGEVWREVFGEVSGLVCWDVRSQKTSAKTSSQKSDASAQQNWQNVHQTWSILVSFKQAIQDKNARISYRQEGGVKQHSKDPSSRERGNRALVIVL